MSRTRKFWLAIAIPALVVAVAFGIQRGEGEPDAAVSASSPFVGIRAFQDLETVVALGPRPSGSDNLARARNYIIQELQSAGLEPQIDRFVANTPAGAIEMANIRAQRPGARKESIAVGGHYDTKRFDFSFLGANDGGSSTAVLLELARVTGDLDLEHTLEFIFFDGEEALRTWSATDSLYGSRFDVDRRFEAGALRDLRALVLVDMVGDRDLGILSEAASTGWLKDIVWDVAANLGHSGAFQGGSSLIEDDHVPYLNAGIAAVDLIDFDYPYWHTPADTLDKTSPRSLQIIGDVVYHSLPLIDQRLR